MPDRLKSGSEPEISPASAQKLAGAREKALENLHLVLTSPNPRKPGTIVGYLSKARRFLASLDEFPPSEMGLRRYFADSRKGGRGEGTLGTDFAVIKELYSANHWDWPFTKRDRPERPPETFSPAFTLDEVTQLIVNRDRYSDRERFYLAISSIFGTRREELARVSRKDIKGNTILIHTAKKGPERWHLIPDEIMPVITTYRPKAHEASSLSYIFQRICEKGLGERKKGYGWHSIRRTLDTLLLPALAREGLPLTFAPEYLRWSKKTIGATFLGSPMAGLYTHSEVLSGGPFAVDRHIIAVHPLLHLWAK